MRKKVKGVVYSEKMRNLPEIFSAVAALGERAIGRIVVLGSYLKNCRNALGHLSDVPAMAKELCVRTSTLTKWMEECGIYVIDHENGMFYYPRYRTLFRLPPHPTDEEIRQFRDCSADYGYLSATDGKRAEKARGEGRKAAVKDAGNAAENDLEMVSNQSANQLSDSQTADNVQVDDSLSIGIGNGIIRKCNDTGNDDSSCCADAEGAGDFDNFEKIISDHQWRVSASRMCGTDLCDDDTLHALATWMYHYCHANGTMPHTADEIRRYAFQLLKPGRKTRRMFDEYMAGCRKPSDSQEHADKQDSTVAPAAHPANYEHTANGVRHASHGEPLPAHAPQQPSAQARWSYMRDCWVAGEGYDERAEWQFEMKRRGERRRKKCSAAHAYTDKEIDGVWRKALTVSMERHDALLCAFDYGACCDGYRGSGHGHRVLGRRAVKYGGTAL